MCHGSKFACGCHQHVCQDERLCLLQSFATNIVRMRSHAGSVQALGLYARLYGEVHSVCRDLPHLPIVQELTHNGGAFLTVCAWVARLLPFPPQNLLRECAVLQSLQGIAGIPNLVHDQCMDDSIFMRLVLDPMAPGAFSAYNLHNTLPSLVQMLKARAMFYA